MKVVGRFSFNGGEDFVKKHHSVLLAEVEAAIACVDAEMHKTKTSKEVTMLGRLLYNPKSLNRAIRGFLFARGWKNHRVACQYSKAYYTPEYVAPAAASARRTPDPYRDMDYVKDKLGVEVQFGKYAFMVYNVCAKMTIFRNLNIIDSGIEVVPVKMFTDEMSTGVSFFEQIVWDLETRGAADIDTPVLILGIG